MSSVPKIKRYESKQYIEFIRELPCCVCGNTEVDAHHAIKTQGSGGSDLMCIPLCRQEHSEYHLMGRHNFEQKYDISIIKIQWRLFQTYIMQLEHHLYGRDNGATMRTTTRNIK